MFFTNGQYATGAELDEYATKLGWIVDASTGVIAIPPNPDNQIESTVVQENIQLPRMCLLSLLALPCSHSISMTELVKVIAHAA